ncbi:sodium/proton antiporter NhaB [Pseudoteredinibacter isoporae]|uniref:Na(+)/H(+) antiporter NhaB n=1 Tax=Pseudoteredinibacter isoporae TaxID=570281 RepID=A0A7X0MYL5_9GAMM|nr:sodium/proton antiporter NhaB [Pseudoteredinibacter isoporae]MBB6523219.1 NhaB family Na+:H+ antiporter [Pseudoteredinibacter isoporae]NHO88736.1 sodium/proton antiporter NhaB [Pseudoteredinibacter isoporae]NIB22573.1 sodium/proton antiporter NhaB [Pseudoteredinibacter isoporae]
MTKTMGQALTSNFLGHAPDWYKKAIIAFLVINPILMVTVGKYITGWIIILEFIFTLAMALKCYPLQPGGLLAIEAIAMGMATPEAVKDELFANFPVILLLMFMVAGIFFMKDLLLYVFTKILLGIRSKMLLSFLFCFASAFLSAFLDALTVTAVLITVAVGFYSVYHKIASGKKFHHDHDHGQDEEVYEYHREDLDKFRSFLRSLIMHGAVGTALGGVCTVVGEPQNLLIANVAGWDFMTFVKVMAPVTMPVLAAGLVTCLLLEKTGWFGYGATLPESVRNVLEDFAEEEDKKRSIKDKAALIVQAVVGVILVVALAQHIAEVGLIGLMIIVLLTAFNGIIDEHQIGHAFEEALPFTALLAVFFAIVAVIHAQHLFEPITALVLSLETEQQAPMLFLANGILSMISDNVFVATVYINEIKVALDSGSITKEHFDKLAIAINTGTNLPSVATPNGQAAFLFLLTSALAPLIRLSYGRMVIMALPYTFVLGGVGLACVIAYV